MREKNMIETDWAIKRLSEAFPDSIVEIRIFREEITVTVTKRDIYGISKFL